MDSTSVLVANKIPLSIYIIKDLIGEIKIIYFHLPPPQALLIESSNRCGRKFRDAQAVLTLAGKARKRLLNNASISRQKCRFLVTTK